MDAQAHPLTADVLARAIVASALTYGDDPVKTVTARQGVQRRALAPAIVGAARGSGHVLANVARIFNVQHSNIAVARRNGGERFQKAMEAAERAARYASWRPEARESVAGAAAEDAVELPPPAVAPKAAQDAPKRAPIPIRTQAHGLIGSSLRPPAPMAPSVRGPESTRGAPAAERPVRDLVLEALGNGPLNSASLATVIGRKEMAVVSALSALMSEHLVASEPVRGGARRFQYRLTKKAAA